MQTIGESVLRSICPSTGEMIRNTCTKVRRGNAIEVKSFLELARMLAQLQYENREHVLLLRGQRSDYRNHKKNTTIKPSIFRLPIGEKQNPNAAVLSARFEKLRKAEELLISEYASDGLPRAREIARRQVLRWAILQHYEVCATPLLDVTQSLRVAVSFAADHDGPEGHIFVLGVPSISGAITTSIEAELQVLRLGSVCPPSALRPHVQEGFLLGEYPDIRVFEQKQLYREHEVDFGRRLIAKFVFEKAVFERSTTFPIIPRRALYPDAKDPVRHLARRIEERLWSSP